ncbi:MAG: SMP-30/gluconolactonase/LRE family protein [Candidatus Hydrogenedentes bacterium]|nr:SMP-30/gluconolactonase/LRE family protein [Candidatus Hydrogenedentota bacterium]MBI3118124.1 SMP-30/gluconolactonase/LRE family protein [Candidatus Hydrogenedentota bacterium]
MKRTLPISLLIVVLLAGAYLLFWPVPITPEAWTPPAAPTLVGPYTANAILHELERLGESPNFAPEDIAVNAEGRAFGGYESGRIIRWNPRGMNAELQVNTGGRPLGLDFDAQGNLIIADAYKGLLSLAPDKTLTTLADSCDGLKFGFTDDVEVAPDGSIYFSDASWKFDVRHYMDDLLEHRGNGRLLRHEPTTRKTEVLLDGLYFANGVAVAPDEQYVLVVETGKYRVMRHWLSGERAGQTEVFIENLPGFPDGISRGTGGLFWLALASPRDATLDRLLPHPFLRKVIRRLPRSLQPGIQRYSFVLGLDGDGKVVHNLQDPGAEYAPITSVQEADGFLYFGSIAEAAYGRFPRPQDPR